MSTSLSKLHRKLLETTTANARALAETACKAALENLAVHEREARSHMNAEQRTLRARLRSRGRALGDARDERTGTMDLRHLVELAAYEHWHRLLFTRFLTENHLLITDEANGNVPVTLEECEELAPELGARDGFDLACRFASVTLPGVFRTGDPVLDLPLALNDQVELRKLLGALPPECFRADDALGWTYQFWQAKRKKEVNDSGKKIGANELSPVTQLFTEDYMVEFLLHNTLGAWWAGNLGPIVGGTESEARAQAALGARDGVRGISWDYLRFVQDETTKTWRPAAGTFEGWPRAASKIRLLDPCMGSGHFLVFALPLLVRLRMEEEGLGAQAAVVAVLRENMFGLELDERCTQIAAFNVALTAWKLAGYQVLPRPHLACSGLAPSATETEWVALAGENYRAQRGMARLYGLFKDAPVLGSLINPRALSGDLIEADFRELAPLLTTALAPIENDGVELAFVAQGLAKAAELLASRFSLVITNVPYLGGNDHSEQLSSHLEQAYKRSRSDLATCFLERCIELTGIAGSAALVTPQAWLFIGPFKKLREHLLASKDFNLIAQLGTRAFEMITGEVVNVNLTVITNARPRKDTQFSTIDVTPRSSATEKATALGTTPIVLLNQVAQLAAPDARIVVETVKNTNLLSYYASSYKGIATGDLERFIQLFWEHSPLTTVWSPMQGRVKTSCAHGGREQVVRWEEGNGSLYQFVSDRLGVESVGAWLRGDDAWTHIGIAIGQMTTLPCTLYRGDLFDENTAAVIPNNADHVLAIWMFCRSQQYRDEIKRVDNSSLKIPNLTLLKVPFDLAHWQAVAAEKYPNGLPAPHSSDPTQWLFNGHPKGSDQPLHVAVARLLGYRWPRQTGSSFPDCPALGPDGLEDFADDDGIVCLPPLNREQPAAARLRQLLAAAFGTFDERALLASAGLKGSKSKNLEDWLRDEFFEQHAKLFHDRPFVWHIWDGRPDGFHALVHYHRLDHATLTKLAYSYLGNWIQQQDADAKADKPGAAVRLGAAQKLQTRLAAIVEGEAPLDLFVRWKPLAEQAQGFHPDLNDGVRQNIRPFLLAGDVGKKGAGLFRALPLSLKDKDRGNEPLRPKKDYPWFWCEEEAGTDPVGGKEFVGSRWNDVHLTLARKRASRA